MYPSPKVCQKKTKSFQLENSELPDQRMMVAHCQRFVSAAKWKGPGGKQKEFYVANIFQPAKKCGHHTEPMPSRGGVCSRKNQKCCADLTPQKHPPQKKKSATIRMKINCTIMHPHLRNSLYGEARAHLDLSKSSVYLPNCACAMVASSSIASRKRKFLLRKFFRSAASLRLRQSTERETKITTKKELVPKKVKNNTK